MPLQEWFSHERGGKRLGGHRFADSAPWLIVFIKAPYLCEQLRFQDSPLPPHAGGNSGTALPPSRPGGLAGAASTER
jgi:hypothetical protein